MIGCKPLGLALLLVGVGALTGCTKSAGPVHTVDWYVHHATGRTAMIDRCNAAARRLDNSADCVNARDAVEDLRNDPALTQSN
ncbi:MAG TPA: EexN family lipoprotein [Nevskiaceae bacterium]|nr:EexN family lipoprotein [Nevskiaceae bacterium]